jgi:hypothetical protein
MDTTTWIWTVIAIVAVVIAVAAAVVMTRRRRTDENRARAAELREQANQQQVGVDRRTAAAEEASSRAAAARAEAERLEAEAADIKATARKYAERHNQTLREADRLDPDVPQQRQATDDERAGADEGSRRRRTG